MIVYINIFIRFLFIILVLSILFYLGVVQNTDLSIFIGRWEAKAEKILSFIQEFLDKYFPVRLE
ncbi:hypothetical protein ARAF_2648 [Arsenophonus endosymbiont of Aleurodicus floccissimus]|nr:hypothetical protein ARAF_2648 [Arsenophonus endosymbiont of Aleurodicus floccissimus]